MKKIGGNKTGIIQTKTTSENRIHEQVPVWTDAVTLTGWLDLASGSSEHTNFYAKIQDSTHYWLCDYQELPGITPENSRMVIDGEVYEILLIDDPMEMHYHYEIYLKYIGGQNNVSKV